MRHEQTKEYKLSYFFLSKAIIKTVLTMASLGQIYRKHKISVKYFIVPKGRNKISKKRIIQISTKNHFKFQT